METPHIIRRQTFELTVPGDLEGRALQERVHRIHGSRLVPAMDEIFCSLASEDEVVQFARVDLHLGALSSGDLEDELIERLRARLAETLANEISTLRSAASPNASDRIIATERAQLAVIRDFLRTGRVPWSTAGPASLDLEALISELIERTPRAMAGMLRAIVEPRVARRIVRQFPDALVRTLVALIAPGPASRFERTIEDWVRVLAEPANDRHAADLATPTDRVGRARKLAQEQILVALAGETEPSVALAATADGIIRKLAAVRPIARGTLIETLARRARALLPPDSGVRAWLEDTRLSTLDRSVSPAAENGAAQSVDADQSGRDITDQSDLPAMPPESAVGRPEDMVTPSGDDSSLSEVAAIPPADAAGWIGGQAGSFDEDSAAPAAKARTSTGGTDRPTKDIDEQTGGAFRPFENAGEESEGASHRPERIGEPDDGATAPGDGIATTPDDVSRPSRSDAVPPDDIDGSTKAVAEPPQDAHATREAEAGADSADTAEGHAFDRRDGKTGSSGQHGSGRGAESSTPEASEYRGVDRAAAGGVAKQGGDITSGISEAPGATRGADQRAPSPAALGSGDAVRPRQRDIAEFEFLESPPDWSHEWQLDSAAGHYIDNAGLILAWPFLARYFGQLGLVEDKAFASEEVQERAVLLLQHLVTGDSQWPEHRLLLNKLLCGWPPDETVAREIELSEAEREESHELLASIVEHWPALKRTSVEGLRASFLQREGRLTHAQDWQLVVGRVGYDVLLDSIPWGIGFITLPWMKEPLFVEW